MLSGVSFQKSSLENDQIVPKFANQYILTDLYLSRKTTSVSTAIMPSITTLVNPGSSLSKIIACILRTAFLVLLSHLPGSQQAIKRISVANTALLYHDGRALATCESGPPIRIQLPSLDTVGWYDGNDAEGELSHPKKISDSSSFGGNGVLSFMREWTTGHPKVDPISGEMLLYHNTFLPPYVHYSVIPNNKSKAPSKAALVNMPVPGVSGAKMMHDFGVSRSHTLIMDLPLTLDPFNLLKNHQIVSYNLDQPSRFGIFPRHDPSNVRWYATTSCCIFHTANMWDFSLKNGEGNSIGLLVCRMTSATLVYSAGNIAAPNIGESFSKPIPPLRVDSVQRRGQKIDSTSEQTSSHEKAPTLESLNLPRSVSSSLSSPFISAVEDEPDQCRLYYFEFDITPSVNGVISHQWALSAIPFEFPSVRPDREMQSARFIYGCSTTSSSFGAALGRAVKIDILAKIDAQTLIRKGKKMQLPPVAGCVDSRSVRDVLSGKRDDDPIQLFQLPPNHFAQEPRFVPRSDSSAEDAGFLLFYVFDESQLLPSGDCPASSVSALWILDAQNMRDVVAKINLPQRVPYGLHGTWFSEEDIARQRPVTRLRSLEEAVKKKETWLKNGSILRRVWMLARDCMERLIG